GPTIRHRKGLRQGDPLSPLLFILAIDPLHRVLKAAVEQDLIAPLPGREIKLKVSLYADDAVIFANLDRHEVDTIMEILNEFRNATGLHVNPAKSTTTPIRCENIDL
uniref:Reverse transcriptase domain-containing protein n=1 Tax=Aegilops tauschii subsp. strangulata TaxID=200361 RepID=A0A453T3H5_AEGTS